MTKIFFDLDGTLVNSKNRLYVLFQKLVSDSHFSYEEYWSLKSQKNNHERILTRYFHNIDFEEFNRKWLAEIETKDMLDLDFLYPNVIDVLEKLKRDNRLFLLTARQNKENLFYELKKLGILKFFEDIFLTEHKMEKEKLIAHLSLTKKDFLVGDTGYDILTAKKLNLSSIAISYGFLGKNILQEYNPDVIIDNLEEIYNV